MLKWDDKYLVGITEIDMQHKSIFKLYNKLENLYKENQENEDGLKDIMHRFMNYALIHFKTEEDYLEMISYPRLEVHRQHHQQFKLELSKISNKKDVSQIYQELLDFLKYWIINHIMEEDQQYGVYVERKKKKR
jgi:hemerythrin-like metal-binding protein